MCVARTMAVVTPGFDARPTRCVVMDDKTMGLGGGRPVEPVEGRKTCPVSQMTAATG